MINIDDNDPSHQFDEIKYMLENAKKYGMEIEVVHEFAKCLRAGDTYYEAVEHALLEWDI